MQLLGQEQKTRGEAQDRAFEREKFAEAQRQAGQTFGLEKDKLESEKTGRINTQMLAADQEARLQKALEETISGNAASRTQKQYEDETARQKLLADALDKVAGVPSQNLSPEARMMISQLPGMAEPMQKLTNTQDMARFMPVLKGAYTEKDPKNRDAMIKAVYGDMPEYVRQNAPWQDLNALIPAAKPGWFGGDGPSGSTITPGPTDPNTGIFSEQGVPIGPPIIDARDYSKFPGSVEDLIRASGRPQQARQVQMSVPPTNQATQSTQTQPQVPTQVTPPAVTVTPPLVQNDVPTEYQPSYQMQGGPQEVSAGVMMPTADMETSDMYQSALNQPAQGPGFVDWLLSMIQGGGGPPQTQAPPQLNTTVAGGYQPPATFSRQGLPATTSADDLLRTLLSQGGESQRLPFTYGSPFPPTQPMPTPIPQRGSFEGLLR